MLKYISMELGTSERERERENYNETSDRRGNVSEITSSAPTSLPLSPCVVQPHDEPRRRLGNYALEAQRTGRVGSHLRDKAAVFLLASRQA